MSGTKKKTIIAIILALSVALGTVGYEFFKNEYSKQQAEKEAGALAQQEAEALAAEQEAARQAEEEREKKGYGDNPLTGLVIADSALGKRPAAIMVENSESARPQWGMDDENYSPDIIMEAEVESGITRTLWIFADFSALPETVGPVRSARPPYVRFSELFDSIYIHWGQSETLGSYIGADDVIVEDGVDNINELDFKSDTEFFYRSDERDVGLEHTGVIMGKNLPQVIEDYGYRTDVNKNRFTTFDFYDDDTRVSDTDCNEIIIDVSSRSWTKHWTYSQEDGLYHTDDFKNDLTRKNIIVMYDETEYITKPRASFSYCNYALDGGEGKYATQGSVIDIVWNVENGKLVFRDKDGQIIKLNHGKTYIAWISANNGGNIEIR